MAGSAEIQTQGRTQRTKLGCLYAFLMPFFAFDLLFLYVGFQNFQSGKAKEGMMVVGCALLFLGVSAAFLIYGIRSHRRNQTQVELEDQNPDAPWLWRPEWRRDRIRSNEGKSAVLFWIMAIAFIGISLPAVLAIPSELKMGNKPILIALLFPLAGVGLGTAAVRATIRMRKFGRSELELHTIPGVIGGTLSGALEIPSKVQAESGFKLRLLCIKRTTSGSGRNRSTHESILWEEEKTILKDYLESEREKTGLPVFFNIPFDQPQSLKGNPAIIWRLEVKADVPGVDYAARFEVPVFKTAESREHALPAPDPTASFQPPADSWKPPANTRIQVTETMRGETELYYPPARNGGALAFLLGFLAIWTGAIWFMLEKKAPVFFPIVFGLFEILLLVLAIQMLLHSVRVVVGRTQIDIDHSLFLLKWHKTIPAGEIQSIKLRNGMQSGTKVYYDIQLVLKSGKKQYAGSRIPDKKHAEWLAGQIRTGAGLSD